MTCIIGSDHAGLSLARELIKVLSNDKRIDKIVEILPNDGERVDYPDYAKSVCGKVAKTSQSFGILICGSGLGMSMCANRFNGIRAALCLNEYMARYARAHNDANVLCLGERVVGVGLALDIMEAFIAGEFEGGRHKIRIDKIEQN